MLSKKFQLIKLSQRFLHNNTRSILFELPEEIRILQETCRNFAESELKPVAAENDELERFPAEAIKKLGLLGMMGIQVSPEYGGANLNTLALSVAIEELSRACASTGAIVSIHNCLYANLLEARGSKKQKDQFLKDFTDGRKLGAFALSEADAGSDVSAMKTTAKKTGNNWLLNGTKAWVTSGVEADAGVVFTTIDRKLNHKGITAFLVDFNDPGVKRGKKEKKLGIRATSTCDIILDNVCVPETCILGEVGEGFKIAMKQLDVARIGIASQAIGIAQACLDLSVNYADQRRVFGEKLLAMSTVQSKLAEMALKIETSRMLTWKAASLRDNNQKFTKYSSMAKWHSGETSNFCASTCIQILGGMGYVTSLPAERLYRDAKITEIYGGTTDIQKMLVGLNLIKQYGLTVL